MNTALLIMAAGIGSRFGTGIKQLEPVDASDHIIMDYSIHDAIEADGSLDADYSLCFHTAVSAFLNNGGPCR